MKIVKSYILSLFLLISVAAASQSKPTHKSIFEKCKRSVGRNLSLNETIVRVGKCFLDTPYVAYTLEGYSEEQLGINLKQLDCTTFLENSLAIAKTIKSKRSTFEQYKTILTRIRYRGGVINRYPSRLHYFSDWITDNSRKEIVVDVTPQISSDTIRFNVGFMSQNPDKYRALTAIPEFIPVIAAQEKSINERLYHYIPKNNIDSLATGIQSGDLIAITTKMKGLDISHVGIAIWQDGKLHLMHASSTLKKVVVSEKTLHDYMQGIQSNTGIIVLRAQ